MPLVVVASVTRTMSQDGYVRDGGRKWENPAYNYEFKFNHRSRRVSLHPSWESNVGGDWCCSACVKNLCRYMKRRTKAAPHRWARRDIKHKIKVILQEELQEVS